MSSLRLLAAVCLTVSTLPAQFSDACFSPTSGTIPNASVGNTCDPRQPRRPTLADAEPVLTSQPRTASISLHQLSHEVPKKARRAYLDAEHSKSTGHLDDAIRHYQRALQLDPRFLEAWNNLASAHIGQGDFAAAEADLAQAYKLDPTASPVLTNLAFVHLSTQRPASAESFARRALQADPLSVKGLYLLGISLAGQNKDKPEAIRLLEKSCGTYGRAHFSLAPLLAEANRLPEAAQHLKAYLALNLPTNRELARQWLKSVEQELARRRP